MMIFWIEAGVLTVSLLAASAILRRERPKAERIAIKQTETK